PEAAGTLVYQTEKEQALDYARRLPYALALGVDHIFSGELVDGKFGCPDGIWYYEGLVTDPASAQYKVAFYTYRFLVEKLGQASIEETIRHGEDGFFLYRFENANKRIWVAWNDGADERALDISGLDSGPLDVVALVADVESGKDLAFDGYPAFFPTTRHTVSTDGKLTLRLHKSPVLFETTVR
ncbi:MAG: hypothetical protein V2A73_08225, partial [Pseudomonadota bacterium]